MEKKDVDRLRQEVPCAAVLEAAGFAIDPRESTRRAMKYRRGDGIIIVIHQGRGWFDPLVGQKRRRVRPRLPPPRLRISRSPGKDRQACERPVCRENIVAAEARSPAVRFHRGSLGKAAQALLFLAKLALPQSGSQHPQQRSAGSDRSGRRS